MLDTAARDLLRLMGEPVPPPTKPPAVAVADAPAWFEYLVEYTSLARRMRFESEDRRRPLLNQCFSRASLYGLTLDSLAGTSPAQTYCRETRGNVWPHETAWTAALLSAFYDAIAATTPAGRLNYLQPDALDYMPFDRTRAHLRFGRPPPWVPAVQTAEAGYGELAVVAAIDWDVVLGQNAGDEWAIIAANVNWAQPESAERSTVLPFLYAVQPGSEPSPQAVFEQLRQRAVARPPMPGGDLDDLDQLTDVGKPLPRFWTPVSSLRMEPLVSRLFLPIRPWHIESMTVLPFVADPLGPFGDQVDAARQDGGALTHATFAGEIVLRGQWWRAGMPRRWNPEFGPNVGFVLSAKRQWLNAVIADSGWRLAWVRQTARRYMEDRRGEASAQESETRFHGLSSIVLATDHKAS